MIGIEEDTHRTLRPMNGQGISWTASNTDTDKNDDNPR